MTDGDDRTASESADTARRFGRPRLPADRARSERVVSFVTPGELECLRKLASVHGSSVSAEVHRILSSALNEE